MTATPALSQATQVDPAVTLTDTAAKTAQGTQGQLTAQVKVSGTYKADKLATLLFETKAYSGRLATVRIVLRESGVLYCEPAVALAGGLSLA